MRHFYRHLTPYLTHIFLLLPDIFLIPRNSNISRYRECYRVRALNYLLPLVRAGKNLEGNESYWNGRMSKSDRTYP